jgi:YqxM protein
MKKAAQVLTKITYGLGLVFLLTGMFLTAMNVPVQAQEETPTSPEVVQTTEPTTDGNPLDASLLTQPEQPAATEVPPEELAVTQGLPVADLTLVCINIADDGSITALLSDNSELPVVDGLVEGTDIVVPEGAALCVIETNTIQTVNWDRSSLTFTAGCTGDCSQITATVCNTGDGDMSGTTTWELYYKSSGNPKPENGGVLVDTGTIPALPGGSGTSGENCAVITLTPSNGNGSYMFRALQRTGHPGQGDLWSGQCNITCTLPTPTLTVSAEQCALSTDGTGYQYSYTVNYANFTSGDKFYYPAGTVVGTADADGTGSFTFSAASSSVTVTTDRGASQSATASQLQLCPQPSIDVSAISCAADLAEEPLTYTFSVSFSNLLVGTSISTTPDSGAHAVTSTSGSFDFTVDANSASAVWSENASVNDSATESKDLQCSQPALSVTGDVCALSENGTTLQYGYSVSFSGFQVGDEISYPGGTYTTTATSGSFTFSSELDSVSVSSPYGAELGSGATGLCPGPSIDISGICAANQDGTGYEYSYVVKYYNLLAGTSISFPGGTHLVEFDGETTDGSFEFTSSESSAAATWSKDETVTDFAEIDSLSCPALDLQVSAESCALNQNGGGAHFTWTVYNPGVLDIDFTWTADPTGNGSGTAPAGGTTTFITNKPTTSVTVVWGAGLSSPAYVSEEVILEPEGRSVTAYPSDEFDCPADVSLLLLAPACSLDANQSWQMTWSVQNPNPWEVEFSFAVNGGALQGPYVLPASLSTGLVNTPLGENTVVVFWNGGKASTSATGNLGLSNCESVPYDPPTVVDQPVLPIPVTGNSVVPTLAAPAAGGEILIPVTGIDLSATQAKALDFWQKLSLNLGALFLGAAFVMSGVRKIML